MMNARNLEKTKKGEIIMNEIKLIDVIGKNFMLAPVIKKINGQKVKIKTYLDADTYSEIIATITDTCFQDDTYHPEYHEIVRKYVILKYFTNIAVSDDMIKEVFKMSQSGTWFADIERTVVSLPVWSDIENTVDEMINYKITVRRTSFDKLCGKIHDLLDAIPMDQTQTLDDIKAVLKGLENVDKKAFIETVTENAIDKNKNKDSDT